jgi:hypothetical protein
MAHECLQRPGVDLARRQGVASGMAQHVSMDRKWQISGHAKPFEVAAGESEMCGLNVPADRRQRMGGRF